MATIKSIEEKAKAYDEALEKARQLCAYPTSKPFISDLQDLFPELKESEDEMIRKDIVEAVELHKDFTQERKEYIYDWLEKQGEQKPVFEMKSPEESLGVDSDTYNKIVDECIYGEQKPADKIESRQERLTEFEKAVKQVMEEAIECGDTHNLKADADMLLRLVQKPWSEEDERNLDWLMTVCERIHYKSDPQVAPDSALMLKDWLKSLRPQKNEALPQWRRLPLNSISYAPDSWRVMDVITSTNGANSASVSALVKGDYYVPLFELEKFIKNV